MKSFFFLFTTALVWGQFSLAASKAGFQPSLCKAATASNRFSSIETKLVDGTKPSFQMTAVSAQGAKCFPESSPIDRETMDRLAQNDGTFGMAFAINCTEDLLSNPQHVGVLNYHFVNKRITLDFEMGGQEHFECFADTEKKSLTPVRLSSFGMI